jgi:hypothetical protein
MNRISALNRRIAEKITSAVATMWVAYLFAAIAQQELAEIKKMSEEIHSILINIESK